MVNINFYATSKLCNFRLHFTCQVKYYEVGCLRYRIINVKCCISVMRVMLKIFKYVFIITLHTSKFNTHNKRILPLNTQINRKDIENLKIVHLAFAKQPHYACVYECCPIADVSPPRASDV